MYSTCLFCRAPLGANERIEHFPVGRRLAFDSAKGRLWVVCPSCSRWNLTPLEARWEAIEECERLLRTTPARLTTDRVGLAVLGPFSLVRVGAPARRELAWWRYGRRLRRRLWGGRAHDVAFFGTVSVALPVALHSLGLGSLIGGAEFASFMLYGFHRGTAFSRCSRRTGLTACEQPFVGDTSIQPFWRRTPTRRAVGCCAFSMTAA